MKKYIFLLILTFIPLAVNAQGITGSFKLNNKQQFRSMFSIGGGFVLKESNNEFKSTFGVSLELDIHLNKGYFIGIGILYHAIPTNKSTSAASLFIQVRKGFYLFDNFAIYGGIGGIIGAVKSSECCSGGAYFSLSADYMLNRYISVGIENKVLVQNIGMFILRIAIYFTIIINNNVPKLVRQGGLGMRKKT